MKKWSPDKLWYADKFEYVVVERKDIEMMLISRAKIKNYNDFFNFMGSIDWELSAIDKDKNDYSLDKFIFKKEIDPRLHKYGQEMTPFAKKKSKEKLKESPFQDALEEMLKILKKSIKKKK
jgi:hypothetical protein|tara:strand:- start:211 stop:573 length:363 start_codon:yes stop_codon:yes gene_type:complete